MGSTANVTTPIPCSLAIALIEKAKAMAREQGIGVVTLAVEPMNTAKKLYQELGFAYQRMIKIFNEEYELYAAEIVV